MWVKTIAILLLHLVPYTLMVTGLGSTSSWIFFGLWFLMAMGMSGIGTAIMHDANHGTYSPNKKVNNFISHILEIISGYSVNWRIQHNVDNDLAQHVHLENNILFPRALAMEKELLKQTG